MPIARPPPEAFERADGGIEPLVEAGPDPEKDRLTRWRCADLNRVLGPRFAVDLEGQPRTYSQEAGFSHISARPRHPKQDPEAIASFKERGSDGVFETMSRLALRTAIRVWFEDEIRGGRRTRSFINGPEGTRPRSERVSVMKTPVFGAVCPSPDTGAAIIMPYADTAAMRRHLKEVVMPSRPAPTPWSFSTSRLAHHAQIQGAEQPHHGIAATSLPGTRCRREHLAIFARPTSPTGIQRLCRQSMLAEDAWRRLLDETGRITSIAAAMGNHRSNNMNLGNIRQSRQFRTPAPYIVAFRIELVPLEWRD